MIDTEQNVVIAAPFGQVWDFAHDIRAWARLMPGLQDCAVIDDNTSRWTLKVGAGALVRTVRVSVSVQRWAGPEEVDFTYTLEGDPVKGGGTYRASPRGPAGTEVAFMVRVEGTGPMAPMWEAMGRPLLPKFARGFADEFKAEAERLAGVAEPSVCQAATQRYPVFAWCMKWLRRMLGRSADVAR